MRALKPLLMKLHRWAALITAPVLLLIVLSGMVLAFKPIVQMGAKASVDVPALITALDQADPQGRAGVLTMASDGKNFELSSRRSGSAGSFDAQTGAKVGEAGFDVFNFARELHVSLLLGARWLVTTVTIISVLIILTGFSGRWTKFRPTLSGWHVNLGWLSWPLVALTPVTGMLMALHLGMPGMPHNASMSGHSSSYGAGRSLPVAQVLEVASKEVDLSKLTQVRNFRGGGVMLTVLDGLQPRQYLVSGSGEVTRTEGPGWVRMLHEGTWAGAWSGVFTLISTCPLLGLLVTGSLKWLRRNTPPRPQS